MIRAVATLMLLVPVLAVAQAQPAEKPDPLSRTYDLTTDAMFPVMGRVIAEKWRVLHSDKDLCLITFEAPETFTNAGMGATATCEATDTGSRVRIKARMKSNISTKGREAKFAKGVLDALADHLDKK